MRSVQEIKKKLSSMRYFKDTAFKKDNDEAYKKFMKCEALLKWVLDDDHVNKARRSKVRVM